MFREVADTIQFIVSGIFFELNRTTLQLVMP